VLWYNCAVASSDTPPLIQTFLVVLQALQVLFLWIHDWVPLGTFTDLNAVRRQDTTRRLVIVTLVQSLPFTVLLLFSAAHLGHRYPGWLDASLWIAYAILFTGELRAWWWPYLVRPDPVRAARYQDMFGRTHAFLPPRNGIVPNTAHVALHACTVLTLILLTTRLR
jgi:hypothetical protein